MGATIAAVGEPTEQLDIVNPATGDLVSTTDRATVHETGAWHQVFHCLVVSQARRSVVLQRRSPAKRAFPGKLDLSVTGHLSAGEAPLDGIREAEEELGVPLDPKRLVPLGTRLLADDGGEDFNRERVHAYMYPDNRQLDGYAPPIAEVDGLVEVEAGNLIRLLGEPGLRVPALSWHQGGAIAAAEIERDDLVTPSDGYWIVMAVMAERYLDGEHPLAV